MLHPSDAHWGEPTIKLERPRPHESAGPFPFRCFRFRKHTPNASCAGSRAAARLRPYLSRRFVFWRSLAHSLAHGIAHLGLPLLLHTSLERVHDVDHRSRKLTL